MNVTEGVDNNQLSCYNNNMERGDNNLSLLSQTTMENYK
jgi:hypothetical protein